MPLSTCHPHQAPILRCKDAHGKSQNSAAVAARCSGAIFLIVGGVEEHGEVEPRWLPIVGLCNAMPSSAERRSAERESSRLLHRDGNGAGRMPNHSP